MCIVEYSLHSQIKNWYSIKGDKIEVKVDDYKVDIVRGDLLIEIQTRNLSAIKKKLAKLLVSRYVRLVYPIAKLSGFYMSLLKESLSVKENPQKRSIRLTFLMN